MSKIEAGITSQNIEDADGDLELTDLLRNWARWANHGDDGGPQQATTCASAERHHPIPVWERSEEHTSELQSLMRISYAVFCLKKKKTIKTSIIALSHHEDVNYTTQNQQS